MDALKVVDAVDCLDAVPLVARLERQAVDKLHEAGHRFVARQMGNVDSLDHAWRGLEPQHFFKASQPLLWVDQKNFRLHVVFQVAPLVERFEQPNLIAEPGRFFKL